MEGKSGLSNFMLSDSVREGRVKMNKTSI